MHICLVQGKVKIITYVSFLHTFHLLHGLDHSLKQLGRQVFLRLCPDAVDNGLPRFSFQQSFLELVREIFLEVLVHREEEHLSVVVLGNQRLRSLVYFEVVEEKFVLVQGAFLVIYFYVFLLRSEKLGYFQYDMSFAL